MVSNPITEPGSGDGERKLQYRAPKLPSNQRRKLGRGSGTALTAHACTDRLAWGLECGVHTPQCLDGPLTCPPLFSIQTTEKIFLHQACPNFLGLHFGISQLWRRTQTVVKSAALLRPGIIKMTQKTLLWLFLRLWSKWTTLSERELGFTSVDTQNRVWEAQGHRPIESLSNLLKDAHPGSKMNTPNTLPCSRNSSHTGVLAVPWTYYSFVYLRAFALALLTRWYVLP